MFNWNKHRRVGRTAPDGRGWRYIFAWLVEAVKPPYLTPSIDPVKTWDDWDQMGDNARKVVLDKFREQLPEHSHELNKARTLTQQEMVAEDHKRDELGKDRIYFPDEGGGIASWIERSLGGEFDPEGEPAEPGREYEGPEQEKLEEEAPPPRSLKELEVKPKEPERPKLKERPKDYRSPRQREPQRGPSVKRRGPEDAQKALDKIEKERAKEEQERLKEWRKKLKKEGPKPEKQKYGPSKPVKDVDPDDPTHQSVSPSNMPEWMKSVEKKPTKKKRKKRRRSLLDIHWFR